MLEILILQTTLFLFLSTRKKYGFANPYSIYYSIWLFVFLGYYFSSDKFNSISSEYFFILNISMFYSFFIMYVSNVGRKKLLVFNRNKQTKFHLLDTIPVNYTLIKFFIIIVAASAFKAYQLALLITDGASIFTPVGFVKLRHALTYEDASFGFYGYFVPMSIVLFMFSLVSFRLKKISIIYFLIIFLSSLFYCYLSTGRTFMLMLMCFSLVPFFVSGVYGVRHFIFSFAILFILFLFIAGMAQKGISFQDDIGDNLSSFFENILGYTIAPFVAMAKLYDSSSGMELGQNIFRFFYVILNKIGLLQEEPVALVKQYVSTPVITNVYTVFEVYYRDFLYASFFIVPLFLVLHNWLYLKARIFAGSWIFYYAISVYPLSMVFFQDMYFSLLSTWLQVIFWIFLFSGFRMRKVKND